MTLLDLRINRDFLKNFFFPISGRQDQVAEASSIQRVDEDSAASLCPLAQPCFLKQSSFKSVG